MKNNSSTTRKALVTAGPTYEELDPVRFIGNHSSGKMGFAIAEELARQGFYVILVTGPTVLTTSHPNITRINTVSAQAMYHACLDHFCNSDIVVFAAAVADYKPVKRMDEKIKKSDTRIFLELEKTIDIAGTLGKIRSEQQVVIGFALETENGKVNAIRKLIAKNFDFVALNSPRDTGAGFGHDTNKITLIGHDGTIQAFDLKPKTEVAYEIIRPALAELRDRSMLKALGQAKIVNTDVG